jgi:hypothetical protein
MALLNQLMEVSLDELTELFIWLEEHGFGVKSTAIGMSEDLDLFSI